MEEIGKWITKLGRHIFIPNRKKILKEINKNYGKSKEFKQNCQMCVVAFEAGLRGIKVNVKGNDFKSPVIDLLSKKPEIAYIDPETNKNPKTLIKQFKDDNELLDYIKKNTKKHERYVLQSDLKTDSKYGHIVCVDSFRDKLRIADPQFGTESETEQDAIKYLKLIDYSKNIGLLRTDNLKFNKDILDMISE